MKQFFLSQIWRNLGRGSRWATLLLAAPLAAPAQTLPLAPASARAAVPEASGYGILYQLDMPNIATFNSTGVPYSTNNSGAAIANPARVAYYLELTNGTTTTYVWTSMANFATTLTQLGIPNPTTNNVILHQSVSNLNVFSNVAGVTTGTNLGTGRIEMWPTDYGTANSDAVPGASGSTYDFGDQPATTRNFGSFQVHNVTAGQTVFAYNNWGSNGDGGGIGNIGIGSQVGGSGHPDWTFQYNANQYSVKRITILANLPDLTVSTGTQISPTPIPAGNYNSITITGTGNGVLAGNVSVASFFTVQPGGGLSDGCSLISGAGTFTLGVGSTLGICNAAGISSSGATGSVQVTGARSFSTAASYGYTGAAAVTGNGLPATVLNLAINTAGNVTLTAPVAVTAAVGVGGAGNLVLGSNALTLLSSATGTALAVNSSTGVVVGTATVQRYIDPSLNAGPGYRHYSSPVSNSTVADLATAGFAPTLTTSYNASATPGTTTPFPTVFGYDQSRVTLANSYAPFDRGYVVPAASATALAVGQGYAVNLAGTELVDFVGTLNNGTLPLALSRVAANTDAGWQLLGNPYPAPLDYSLVAPADRTNLDGAIYVYSSTGQYVGQYRSYVNGVGGNSVLPLGQGFFARVSAGQTSGSLTFRNSQRLTAPDATAFQRGTATATDTRPLVQLELRGPTGAADALYAYAQAGATPAFDSQFDAEKISNSTGLNLSSTATSGQRLAIDGRPVFDATTQLPLNVGVPAAGTYTFATAALNNLPAGLDAYLSDAQTGQTVNLRQQPSYPFSVTAAQATALLVGRFSLRFSARPLASAPALTAAQVALYPNPAHGVFTVLMPGVAGATSVQAELVNALGQVVHRQAAALPASGATLTVQTGELATGVYTLRLLAGPASLAKRIVIQ